MIINNPLFKKGNLKEYISYGLLAAVLYMIPVLFFLSNHKYENFYYLYIGCALFMAGIFYYGYKLLYRRTDQKKAISPMIKGLLATIAGILIACVILLIATWCFFPNLLSAIPADKVVAGAPAVDKVNYPGGLLMMMIATATIGNFGVGSFITVIVSNAGRKEQDRDKPQRIIYK